MLGRNGSLIAATVLALVAIAARGQVVAAATEITDRREILFAYDQAADAGRFDDALRHAVNGCERLYMLYLCREVADLPLQMARQGIVASAHYSSELRRVANVVCLSGKSLIRSGDVNTTGFLCGYYAQQYARAHGPIHRNAFLTRAWQYLDSIYDPPFAERLYEAACKNGNHDACKRSVARAGSSAQ